MKPLRRAALLTAALVLLACLSGCSKEPTAKDLMGGIPQTDPEKFYDFDIAMDMTMSIDGQDTTMTLSGRAEGRGALMHLYDLDMSVGASGLNLAITMEMWMNMAEDVMYARMTLLGQDSGWLRIAGGLADAGFSFSDLTNAAGGIGELDLDAVDLVLEPHEKGSDYVVTWTGDGAALEEMTGMVNGFSGLEGDGADEMDIRSASMAACFDEKTHALKSVRIESEMDESGTAAAVSVTVTYHEMTGDKELAIPQEVAESALDADGLL